MNSKKGQVSLENALPIVLIVGLAFLIMGTIAFIGDKYGDALREDDVSVTVANETLTTVTEAGEYLTYYDENDVTCTVIEILNTTAGTIPTTNYTATNCLITAVGTPLNNTNWNVSYTAVFDRDTTATNITTSLNTEVSSNTSIMGIVLTISLVGIVLTVLIGVFAGVRARKI